MDVDHASIRWGEGLRGRPAGADMACPACGCNLRGATPALIGAILSIVPSVTVVWWWWSRRGWDASDAHRRRVRLGVAIAGALMPIVGVAIAL